MTSDFDKFLSNPVGFGINLVGIFINLVVRTIEFKLVSTRCIFDNILTTK